MAKTDFKNIDEYQVSFTGDILNRMSAVRKMVHELVPEAEEVISYQIPAFKIGKHFLIYYCAFEKHLSLSSPWSQAFLKNFETELRSYKVSKSVIQFPHSKKLPIKFIRDIINFRKKEIGSSEIKEEAKPKLPKTGTQPSIAPDITAYNRVQSKTDKAICETLSVEITKGLPGAENKVWHGHPVWFLDGNPIVGYSKQKNGIRLMFWSGADFEEDDLSVRSEKFKDASIFYNDKKEIETKDLQRWLKKSKTIQWDYKNIVKRKGKLERLK